MTPQSAKAKGRNLQKLFRDLILATFPTLQPDDVRSTSMGAGGEDLQLSPAARSAFPYTVECKARAGVKTLYSWFDQAKGHGKGEPLLVLKGDRREPLAIITAKHFMELIAK